MTEDHCHKLFTELGLVNLQIERAHRTGPQKSGQPRTIIVKMLSYKDRKRILKKARVSKPKGIYFNKDFSVRVSQICKNLRSKLQKLRGDGHTAFISFNKIRYHSQPGGQGTGGTTTRTFTSFQHRNHGQNSQRQPQNLHQA